MKSTKDTNETSHMELPQPGKRKLGIAMLYLQFNLLLPFKSQFTDDTTRCAVLELGTLKEAKLPILKTDMGLTTLRCMAEEE